MKSKVKETFNQLAPIYETSVDTTSLYNSEYERPAMLAQLPVDLTGMKVLDAGCAAGWYTLQLKNRGARVAAADISPEMVRSAKRRIGEAAEIICLDLEEDLPFQNESFDIILSSLTLHYMKDWQKPFDEFQRVLKPNGIFLFSVHHPFLDVNWLENADYFNRQLIVDQWNKDGKVFNVPFYRRPLAEIMNSTLLHFWIEQVIEPLPTPRFKELSPASYERLLKRPQFLILKARKKT